MLVRSSVVAMTAIWIGPLQAAGGAESFSVQPRAVEERLAVGIAQRRPVYRLAA